MTETDAGREPPSSAVAIIGMACRFPGARDIAAFWRNLCDGVESITFLRDDEIEPSSVDPAAPDDPHYVKAAALIDDADLFDAALFGYTPREAELIDPQQRVFLECAHQALEHAGYDPERYPGAIGVFAGSRTNTYLFNLFSNPGALGATSAFEVGLGNDAGFLSTRVSYKLQLRGPSVAVQTACSTALVAAHLACQSLLTGECQIALAGAVSINVPQKAGYLYQPGGIVSPDGHCRAFDAQAQGTIFGSGAGVVVLKRLADALADGDTIYAVIRGSATNNDGAPKASFSAPDVHGQTEVILDALAVAETPAETIGYVEAHGTGTALGDPIEVRALTSAFREHTDRSGFCALGSVKSNIGHLDAAAGVASLIKTVLALQNGQIPPSLHVAQPNPHIDWDASPFYVNTALRDWPAPAEGPRRAGVSAFGVGGTNAHMILEEPPPRAEAPAPAWQILPISAQSAAALDAATANLAAHLRENPGLSLADAAHTLQVGRRAFARRRVLAARDRDDALAALDDAATRAPAALAADEDPPIVFMLPGQGVDLAEQGRALYDRAPAFRAALDRCAEILLPHIGCDIREALWAGEGAARPQAPATLDQTWLAQPALFALEYALAQQWMAWGARPWALIGHSLGEYVAATIAGVIGLEDALDLIALRGRLMQQTPEGAMLAASLPEGEALALIESPLALAAVNGPDLCVVAGPSDAVAALRRRLAEQDVDCRLLRTARAFHSPLMDAVADPFAERMRAVALRPPQIPYMSNLTGTWVTAEQATDPAYWARQLRQTVRFSDGLATLLRAGSPLLIEVGPGQTLSRLARRHPEASAARAVLASLPAEAGADEVAGLLAAAGQAWLAGGALHGPFLTGEGRQRVALPTYPFERRRYWIAPQPGGAATQARAAGKRADIAEWFARPAWRVDPLPLARKEAMARHWLALGDGGSLEAALIERLRAEDHTVTLARAGSRFTRVAPGEYTIDPAAPADYAALIAELDRAAPPLAGVLHLWSLGPAQSSAEGFAAAQERGFYSLLFLAQALAARAATDPLPIEIVTDRVCDVSGEEEASPEKATILGPCMVIPQEYPHMICRCVDVRAPAPGTRQERRLVDQLVAEFAADAPDLLAAYRGEQRWVRRFAPTRLPGDAAPARPLRERGVYLITGGLGGVGSLLAEHLARTVRARLILAGRTPLPERERWPIWLAEHDEQDRASRAIRQVQSLEALGSEVLAVGADVADAAQMRALIARIEARFGRIDGVLHAAGITSGSSLYSPLTEIGPADAETQFRPKAHGLYAIEQALAGRAVDFCLLFSSNASVLGGLGFFTYAAANLFMDAFAASRSKTSPIAWISASWDPWPEETRKYAGFQTSMDQYTMSAEESLEAFRRVVAAAPEGHVVVATGDLAERLDRWTRRGAAQKVLDAGGAAQAAHPRPQIPDAYVAPRTEAERAIVTIWEQILGIEQVGVNDNFFDLGGHSLLATRLLARLRTHFQVDLPIRAFFETPTPDGLARLLADQQPEPADQETLDILSMLAQLSEEEADAEMRRRISIAE